MSDACPVSLDRPAAQAFLAAIRESLGFPAAALDRAGFATEGDLPSAFAVSDFAAAAVAAAGLALSELVSALSGSAPNVAVDRRLASAWFGFSIAPVGWSLPSPWDPIAGDYEARDGWIRLHTNAPRHREAALAVLGTPPEKARLAAAVRAWDADALETAVVERGGAAAAMRSLADWAGHRQGRAVAQEPVVHCARTPSASSPWPGRRERPLEGLRVLDCTRVLAGPVATRLLAGFGAEVLRIDPPDWDEPAVTPDVTLGKRCAWLDLRRPDGRQRFEALLARADLFIHGLRPGALEGLGFGAAARRRLRPGLIDVSLDAYGWTGPWSGRRGFDSLLQMSSGIADAGMRRFRSDRPKPLPVQALDHAAGYVMAAAALRGLTLRLSEGAGFEGRTSLARMAALLTSAPGESAGAAFALLGDDDYAPAAEATAWGQARRLKPPVTVDGAPVAWTLPASPLGSATPEWLPG
jgi:hypothetical protein